MPEIRSLRRHPVSYETCGEVSQSHRILAQRYDVKMMNEMTKESKAHVPDQNDSQRMRLLLRLIWRKVQARQAQTLDRFRHLERNACKDKKYLAIAEHGDARRRESGATPPQALIADSSAQEG